MRKGSIYLQLSGHRKPTSIYCNKCRRFHDTHRGLNPEACPLESFGVNRPVPHPAVTAKSAAPAHIPREKLGTPPKVKNWQVVKMVGLQGTENGT